MKNISIICIVFCCFVLEGKVQKLDLAAAIERKIVKTKVSALGVFQGESLMLQAQSLVRDSILLMIPAGHRFVSQDPSFQDMLVVKEQMIVLKGFGSASARVSAFCCEAGDRVPAKNALYSTGKMAAPALTELARFINEKNYEEDVIQQAVWSISDGHGVSAIASLNDSCVLPLKKLAASLRGETLPWYSLLTARVVYKNGVIVVVPLRLKGELPCTLTDNVYITLNIYDEGGLPVLLSKSEWLNAETGRAYQLDLPVKGLSKGKYTVKLESREACHATAVFEI